MAAEITYYSSSNPYTFECPQSHESVNIHEGKVPRKTPKYFSLDAAVCCGDNMFLEEVVKKMVTMHFNGASPMKQQQASTETISGTQAA